MKRYLVMCLMVLAVACGDDASSTTTTVETTTTTTTVAATTSTVMPTTTEAPTTTTEATTTTVAATTTTVAAAVPAGSGCTPSGDVLPNGTWYGFIENIDAAESEFTFDLACVFEGDQQPIAILEDGRSLDAYMEFSPYFRNRNEKQFIIPAFGATLVSDPFLGNMDWDMWIVSIPSGDGCSADSGYDKCPVKIVIDFDVAVEISVYPEWSGDGRGA